MNPIFSKLKLLVLFSICMLINFAGCGDDEKPGTSEGEKTKSEFSKGCKIDTSQVVKISIEGNMINYYDLDQFFLDGKKKILIGYNRPANQLEFIDFDKKRGIYNIPFSEEGPNAIPKVNGFFYHNKDSIFIVSTFSLLLINDKGEIKFSKKINRENSDISCIDFSRQFIDVHRDRPLYFDEDENALYFSIRRVDYDQWSFPEHYEGSICAKLSLQTFEVELLPVYYPQDFKETNYGLLNPPNITFLRDKIIYNFKINSKVYVYDKKTSRIKEISPNSKYSNQSASPYFGLTGDQPSLVKHITANPDFGRLIYDEFHNLYYRFLLIPKVDSRGKGLYLSILNENFEIIKEFKFPAGHFHLGALPTPDGLMSYIYGQKENESRYKFFKLICN